MSDIQFKCPHCDNSLLVDAAGAGMQVQCPDCQNAIVIPRPRPAAPTVTKESIPPPPPPMSQATRKESKMKEYKVMTQKDKWFAGKFDPDKLEQAINSYAAQGWQVISVATATIPGFGGNREEMIVVMGRDK